MIKLKMQNAVVEMEYLNITCWDFTEDNPDLHHIDIIKGIKSTYDELFEKINDFYYDDFHLYIDKDYSITCKFKEDSIIIECLDLTLETLKQDYEEDIISINTDLTEREDILISKWKELSFKEFKEKFNLKGTKQQLREKYNKKVITNEDRNNSFYVIINEGRNNIYYELNKDVQEGKYIIYYSCDLGSIKKII